MTGKEKEEGAHTQTQKNNVYSLPTFFSRSATHNTGTRDMFFFLSHTKEVPANETCGPELHSGFRCCLLFCSLLTQTISGCSVHYTTNYFLLSFTWNRFFFLHKRRQLDYTPQPHAPLHPFSAHLNNTY